MFSATNAFDDDDLAMYQQHMLQRAGMSGRPRRGFNEYFRCYPIAMMPGPERDHLNHGGKVFLPASALDKLTRLHITYPMMFELINGAAQKTSHAGVLEFTAEEGKIYVPYWLLRQLQLEPGDLLQIKSTDIPSGRFVKLQPQSPDFLDISDPRAVLERAFQSFSCLTTGDIFTFEYNDNTYSVAVLETKPKNEKNAISVVETDLEVDFAAPVGYKEPERTSGTSTPRSAVSGRGALAGQGGTIHSQGSMAKAINYAAIAPTSTQAADGAKAVSSHFLAGGHKLSSKKGAKAPTPKPSTPVAGAASTPLPTIARRNGPQPLRLPPGKLFFGYEIKPMKGKGEQAGDEGKKTFQGEGQSLRKKRGDK